MAARDAARLRQGLNPLTTSSQSQSQSQSPYGARPSSPISAVSMTSMASSLAPSAHTPGSAIQPYNPQEWAPSQAPAVPDMSRHSQASALPPPPYSPPRSRRPRPMSTAFEHTMAITQHRHRPSPEPQATTSFPPPPGTGGRGGSRERRFGLPSLSRRKDSEPSSSSPEPQATTLFVRRSMGPAAVHQEPEMFAEPASIPPGVGPPAARRAVSAGAADTPTSQRSRSTSQTRWEPGMPIPPPPPGPPPSSSRSHSVQSMDRNTVPIISPPTRRPPPTGVSSLGPVPPTPADWIDSDSGPARKDSPSPALVIDTAAAASAKNVPEPLGSSSSNSGLSRAKAVRHDKTILQRRTESRQSVHGSIDSTVHQISDIVVPGASGRLPASKLTPHSGGPPADSRNSTPRAPASAQQMETATPPFSPYQGKRAVLSAGMSVPKSLPTPPPQTRSSSGSRLRDSSRPPPSASKQAIATQTAEQFAMATVERFKAFASSEAEAPSDADRVRLFADFIVSESRVRRERYGTAIGAMGSEIFDLTRDLFRPMATTISSRRESGTSQEEWTPSSDLSASRDSTASSFHHSDGLSNSAPASANLPTSPNGGPPAGGANWTAPGYMPSLSPILSMSVSDNYENGSSRGRPPSRWWETDSQGEQRLFERSKRESKYMGLPKAQWLEDEQGSSAYVGGSSSEYPPEKVGWHDARESSTPQPASRPSGGGTPAVSNVSPASTNNPDALDVSRLVTMPPPYPRHHPAVNNSHPQLTTIRSSVRALNDITELDRSKEQFALSSSKRREEFAKATSGRRQELMANLQKEISSGNLGYADAAVIESDAQEQEQGKKKDLEKSEYEHFQNEVILPLNDMVTGRISRATDLFDDLVRHLFDSEEMNADMPQEEGDDRPELLEKLTLLKWIFESRESLHRAIYDLLSDRNARYCEVVVTPYRLSGNAEKLRSAETFFAEDAAKREYAYANEVLDRAREFRAVIEEAAQRGIALQLSAFWDIAPPLRELLDSIPQRMRGFSIQIPSSEFEENPAYHEHPLQYLYSVLLHGEKSTYQFIEAHANLLCLLHEAKEAVVHAKARVLATKTCEADGTLIDAPERERRAQAMRQADSRRLTEDLKDKVGEVQEQWRSALGDGIDSVKARTSEWLRQTGGWDDALDEGADGFGVG